MSCALLLKISLVTVQKENDYRFNQCSNVNIAISGAAKNQNNPTNCQNHITAQ